MNLEKLKQEVDFKTEERNDLDLEVQEKLKKDEKYQETEEGVKLVNQINKLGEEIDALENQIAIIKSNE